VNVRALIPVLAIAVFITGISAATVASASQKAGGPCDRVIKPRQNPVSFVRSIPAGRTGCLREGTRHASGWVRFSRPNVTLRSLPGQRAKLVGRIWIARGANGVTIRGLRLNGHNKERLPSPTVNANNVSFKGNGITNNHTATCFILGNRKYGRARGTLIENNRIHDCGKLPATNHQHGIYVAYARGTVIRGNTIYDNADRGVQLYPDADRSLITGNSIYGNGQGIIFAGDGIHTSQNNLVSGNVIKNSRLRFNVESSWSGQIGTGNMVRGNCIFGGARDSISGGIQQPSVGFDARNNVIRKERCDGPR
jgi:parallel beta-helix repeat protein